MLSHAGLHARDALDSTLTSHREECDISSRWRLSSAGATRLAWPLSHLGELTSFTPGQMSCRQSEIESLWNFSDLCFLPLSAAAALHLAGAGGCHRFSWPLLNLKKTSHVWIPLWFIFACVSAGGEGCDLGRAKRHQPPAAPTAFQECYWQESRSHTWNHSHLVPVNVEYKPGVCLYSVSHVSVCVFAWVCVFCEPLDRQEIESLLKALSITLSPACVSVHVDGCKRPVEI